MKRREGLPPISRADARVLILGSFPGELSLERRQYYAHPRNAFWPIMGELFGAGPDLPYDRRLRRLLSCGVALWDVAQHCQRERSADPTITDVEPNDIASLLRSHRRIRTIFLNGAKADSLYRQHVLPDLPKALADLRRVRLPSTNARRIARRTLPVGTACGFAAFSP